MDGVVSEVLQRYFTLLPVAVILEEAPSQNRLIPVILTEAVNSLTESNALPLQPFVVSNTITEYLPAIESSLISMLEPILNPVWVFIGYGENPGYWAIVGGLVIIAALIFRLYWIEMHQKQGYPT